MSEGLLRRALAHITKAGRWIRFNGGADTVAVIVRLDRRGLVQVDYEFNLVRAVRTL